MKVKIEIDGEIKVDMESDLCFFSVGDKNNPGEARTGMHGAASAIRICAQLAGSVVGAIKGLNPDPMLQKLLLALVAAGMTMDSDDEAEAEENRIKEFLN